MLNLAPDGAWVEIKYQEKDRVVNTAKIFYPSMRKGSNLIDSFTADFLKDHPNIILLDVKII